MIFPALSPMGQSLRNGREQWLGPYRTASGAAPDFVLDFASGRYGVAGRQSQNPVTGGRLSQAALDGGAAGLLIEPERTNLAANSVARAETWSPVGPVTMTTLTETAFGQFPGLSIVSAGAAWHRASPGNMTFAAGTTYAVQVWYRATASTLKLTLYSSATTPATNLELQGAAGAIGAVLQNQGTVQSVQNHSFGGGLFRLSFTFSVAATLTTGWGFGSGSATVGDEIVVYALQIEAAETPSGYILADGAIATRMADAVQVSAVNWGQDAAGSVAFGASGGWGSGYVTLQDTAGGEVECLSSATGEIILKHTTGGVISTLASGVVVPSGTQASVAFAWGPNQLSLAANGSAPVVLAVPGLGALSDMKFSAASAGEVYGPALFSAVRHYAVQLDASDLQALTA